MKSLQKIQFLELHLLQMIHLLHHKLLQNNQSLHLIRQLLKMLMMKWIILLLAQKEVVVMIALMRNQIVLQQKSLPLVPQPVGRMALLCQKEGKGEIYQRSLPSLLTLLNPGREPSQGDKSPRRNPRFATNTNEGSVTGEQGPNGRDRSPIRHPNGEKPKVANKPSHLSKSKTNKNSNA